MALFVKHICVCVCVYIYIYMCVYIYVCVYICVCLYMCVCVYIYVGFLHSLVGKEFACNAGDPSLIPRLERSPGEGIGYPLQYSWASLVLRW